MKDLPLLNLFNYIYNTQNNLLVHFFKAAQLKQNLAKQVQGISFWYEIQKGYLI